jgi:hypothetical protein
MFVGHNKSGTSMVGSLLDAHPEVILSDEADALDYVRAGFSREQIFHILLGQSRRGSPQRTGDSEAIAALFVPGAGAVAGALPQLAGDRGQHGWLLHAQARS